MESRCRPCRVAEPRPTFRLTASPPCRRRSVPDQPPPCSLLLAPLRPAHISSADLFSLHSCQEGKLAAPRPNSLCLVLDHRRTSNAVISSYLGRPEQPALFAETQLRVSFRGPQRAGWSGLSPPTRQPHGPTGQRPHRLSLAAISIFLFYQPGASCSHPLINQSRPDRTARRAPNTSALAPESSDGDASRDGSLGKAHQEIPLRMGTVRVSAQPSTAAAR